MTFPSWARIALGLLVAFITFLLTGGVFNIPEDARALIASLVALVASAGIVPPKPGEVRLPQAVSLALTAVAIILTYLLNSAFGLDEILRGILTALVALLASIGITPPQVARR